MHELRANVRYLILMMGLLVGAALACNAPRGGSPSPPPPPSQTSTPTATTESTTRETTESLPAPQTIPAAPDGTEPTPGPGTELPTFTPIQPTLAATLTPSQTPRPPVPPRPSATPTNTTPTATSTAEGPLQFSYHITWRLVPGNTKQSIATVEIWATGGGGGYKYFRDDLPVAGSTFEYEWASCKGNPGSLRVDSASGESVKKDFFETPWPDGNLPCPTRTPTPGP